MRYRRFGKTELMMPVFTCGGMRYQHSWSDLPASDVPATGQANVEATIHRAFELGIHHIAKGLNLVDWGKMRYNLLGRGHDWFPGQNAGNLDNPGLKAALSGSGRADRLLEALGRPTLCSRGKRELGSVRANALTAGGRTARIQEPPMKVKLASSLLVFSSFVFAACGDDEAGPGDGASGAGGVAGATGTTSELDTGAICPTDSNLGYANFAEEFLETYCATCHATGLSAPNRNGAPASVNLDTLAGAMAVGKVTIDRYAGAGPDAVRTVMPPSNNGAIPSQAERRQLSEWLACDLPP